MDVKLGLTVGNKLDGPVKPSKYNSSTRSANSWPIMSVYYRLSPQTLFPAALLDALVSYLALISPPPGAFHAAIPPRIVLASNSSGASLTAALFLLLLHLPLTLRFHSKGISVKAPAGLALTSPWLDVSRALPSVHRIEFPQDAVWQTQPERVETYCEAPMVGHPLVSPVAASAELWTGTGALWV